MSLEVYQGKPRKSGYAAFVFAGRPAKILGKDLRKENEKALGKTMHPIRGHAIV